MKIAFLILVASGVIAYSLIPGPPEPTNKTTDSVQAPVIDYSSSEKSRSTIRTVVVHKPISTTPKPQPVREETAEERYRRLQNVVAGVWEYSEDISYLAHSSTDLKEAKLNGVIMLHENGTYSEAVRWSYLRGNFFTKRGEAVIHWRGLWNWRDKEKELWLGCSKANRTVDSVSGSMQREWAEEFAKNQHFPRIISATLQGDRLTLRERDGFVFHCIRKGP